MSTGQGFEGYNMYAYCMNNPVMFADFSGTYEVPNTNCGWISDEAISVWIYLNGEHPEPWMIDPDFFIYYMYWDFGIDLIIYNTYTVPIEGATFREDYPNYEASDTYHGATDLSAPIGTPVLAAFSGKIVHSETHRSYGINVVIESVIENNTYRSIYAHLDSIVWDVGTYVKSGDVIGYVGMTGNTSGPHLHFEMRISPFNYRVNNIDPREFWR